MKALTQIGRILTGLLFVFSGFVKGIDPMGTAFKLGDYFTAFGVGFLHDLALPLAIILCLVEFVTGMMLLTGSLVRLASWMAALFMALFTPLTLVLAIFNPVSDCGCFGDAIHLTNWQTFGKNMVLIAMVIVLFAWRKHIKQLFSKTVEWVVIAGVIIVFVLFAGANLRYLPVIDFLPYKTGVKIADKMVIPDSLSGDEYLTTFIYEKNGIIKEFNLNNYPAHDSTWKFVDQKSILIKRGYKPPIHDFIITTLNGEDLTQKVLSCPGYSVLMISKKLAEAGNKSLSGGFALGNYCHANGINFYILTSSVTEEVRSYNNGLMFCSVDETTLKTMVRANPGYILIKDGIILGKWSWANVPDKEWFGKLSDK